MQYPFLKTLKIKNYKNLTMGNAPLELHQLNVFIGPNCCGKSNLIGIFQFLKNCVAARVEADVGLTGLEVALDHFGGAKILDGTIARPAYVNFDFEFSSTELMLNGSMLELSIDIPNDRRLTILNESLRTNSTSNPFYFYRCHDWESGKGVVSIYKRDEY